jgi:hypothetical protein
MLFSCESKSKPAHNFLKDTAVTDSLLKFIKLEFLIDGKPCIALINDSFKDFNQKKQFPLSVFITINTDETDSDGHPTDKEAAIFNTIEAKILAALDADTDFCYIGKTTMNGYRDMMLYIKKEDQRKINNKLKDIQRENKRIKSYTYENDPEWEAVSEFYTAIGIGK